MNEIKRIKKVYRKRDQNNIKRIYTYFNPSSLYIYQEREKVILNLLRKYKFDILHNKKILDVGCGNGGVLRDFIKYGALPENLYGIDLLEDRIETAKKLSPNMHFTTGNAENLPYSDEFFDIVLCFTVFTSIFDKNMKKNIAKEMLRVLKKDGFILWYDYFIDNPKNPDVKGVKKKEIHELFPDCKISLKRITLAPPITRLLAPYSWLLCYLLEKLKILNTHYIGVIRK